MHMRKSSSPRLDVSLRTTEVIGLCALSSVQLAAQGVLGADMLKHVRMLTRELAQQQHRAQIFRAPHDACLLHYAYLGERFRRPHRMCFIDPEATVSNPMHEKNYMAFTLDFPDAGKPSLGATIHPLSRCFCRYMVIIHH